MVNKRCGDQESGGIGWTCSLAPGHDGDHIAYHHHEACRGVITKWYREMPQTGARPTPPNFDTNPKDLIGAKKVSHTALPDIATLHGNRAMMDGARKYGAFNWREKKIQADIYVDAARRHIAAWFDREEFAEDSGVHHLGHAIATLGILLDAQANDALVDNRPPKGGAYVRELAKLNKELSK